MRSCFPSWLLLCSLSPLGFYTPFVIAPESGAGKLQLRFIACVSHSAFFGFRTRLPSSLIYEIRGLSCRIVSDLFPPGLCLFSGFFAGLHHAMLCGL